MLLLIVEAGGARYGVAASHIVEVIPVPVLRPLPGTAAAVAGVFSYHGSIVPVIDLTVLLTGRPSRQVLSTRILLVSLEATRGAGPVLFGVMAEHATETLECNRAEFQPAGINGVAVPFAGDILVRPDGLLQELRVDRMLTAELHQQLSAGESALL